MSDVPPAPREPNINSGMTDWLDLLRRRFNDRVPAGTIRPSLAATEDAGWKICDGQSIAKVRYAGLYAVIGGTYGETATTFQVPDLSAVTLGGATIYWSVKT